MLSFAHVNGLPSVSWYIGLAMDKDKAYASLKNFRISAVLATLVAVVVIILLLGMLITVLMRPLNVMGRAMQATEEQTAVVEAINIDISEINALNQEGVENLQATLRACSDLKQQAIRLNQLVGSFKI